VAVAASDGEQRLTFRVGDRHYALPVDAVREVARRPVLTRVPMAPDSLIGLANLRGRVLPVVSLAALLGETPAVAGLVIVLEQADPVGLLDRVTALGADSDDARLLDVAALLAGTFGSAPARDRVGRVGMVTAPTREAESDRVALLGFVIGTQHFALPLEQIEEVIRLPGDITAFPQADTVVIGTIARHGRLLPLLALDRLLALPRGDTQRQRVVIVRIGAHRVGMVVDAVSEILRVDPATIDVVPAVLARGTGEAAIQAICRRDDGRLVSILAADHLLRTDLGPLPQHPEDDMARDDDAEGEQFLLFRLGDQESGQEFGLPIAVVSEVTTLPATLTPLPRAPAFVEGVMNLRGQVVPVIDQRRRFLGEPATGKRRRVIVVALGETLAGFVVDMVTEVRRIPTDEVRAAPALGGIDTRVFDRVAAPDGAARMILIVEPGELLDHAERDLLAAMAPA
jgi:purine-binding chemotaxis protein CheW